MSSSSKNIVIVGAGGGAMVARDLSKSLPKDYSVILIDSLKVAFHQVSSLRSSVLSGHETKSVHDLSDFFPKDSNHKVINAKAVEIKDGAVGLDREVEGFGNKVDYKYLIVATGSTYAFPASPKGTSQEEVLENLRKTQREVKDAQHILIVGGGPVGVEFAGEVKEVYPTKKVTLLSSSNFLVDSKMPSLSSKLQSQLKSKGVSVHLSSRLDVSNLSPGPISEARDFDLPNGETIKNVDFLLLAVGSKPNVSLIKNSDPNAIVEQNGVEVAKVDQQLRLVSDTLHNTYVLGDAMGGRTAMNLLQQAPAMSANIAALVKNENAKLKAWKPMEGIIVVPIGPTGGAGHIPGSNYFGALGGWFVGMVKGKDLFTSKWHATYVA